MSMIQLILILVLILTGVALWQVNTKTRERSKIKNLLNVVLVVDFVLYVLSAFGVFGALPATHLGR